MVDDRISQAMLQDQNWLHRTAKKLKRLEQQGKPHPTLAQQFEARLQFSIHRRESRTASVPELTFGGDLPILSYRQDIGSALREHQVIVVAGETGSGKSTQLPKICLDAGFGLGGLIGHTQPRRIAARSVAARIAEELRLPLGSVVGYKVRFQDKTDPETYIKLMTDGILLAEAAHDRFLRQYELIIIDEAHERSLNIDFLLGMLPGLLIQRPELKLIITSATIDAERFGSHFGTERNPAPVISVEGRTYPVEVRYRPLQNEDSTSISVFQGVLQAVYELSQEGDMLVFLPTERDIRDMAKRLRADALVQRLRYEILPLYARLSAADQDRIFHPGPSRRIVLATNVAESSLTVPRIHSVIDSGTARMSRFSPRLRMQRLPVESVSRASADQRKGRCGRLGPGICIRLFDQEDFQSRSPFTTPEIRRTNLAAVILQAKYLGIGEVDTIPFLDPPRPDTVREGYKTLFEIGAVDDRRKLTSMGRTLATLPVDPRIGRMILAGNDEDCLAEILIIASALEVQDPRVRPLDHQQAADQHHKQFQHDASDFLSYLQLWDFIEEKRRDLSHGQFRRMAEQMYLSPARLREWGEVHRQLKQTAKDNDMYTRKRRDDSTAIHRALLTGLLSCAAYRADGREYTGAGGSKFYLWPGSGLTESQPKWIMAAEWVETSRRFGRTAARIDPRWLEQLGEHVSKRSYTDPHWHAKSQSVMAFESVTLFGLPIVTRRRVPFGHLDLITSRQIFIEEGLVAQKIEAPDSFFTHNADVRAKADGLAAQTRNRDLILDDYRVHVFYQERLPDDVYDMSSLRRYLKQHPEAEQPLFMSLEDLTATAGLDPSQFPEYLMVGNMQLPLNYHFEPGASDDGVTVTVPAEALPQLHPGQLDWLVPGLLEEKLVALIRSLPKAIRRSLVPAPETAARVASELEFGKNEFRLEVAMHFSRVAGEPISPDHFRTQKLDPHLHMRVRVVDAHGVELASGRDVRALQTRSPNAPRVEISDNAWHRDDVREWDFGELPKEIQVERGGIRVTLFPALVEFDDATLGLRLEETSGIAEAHTRCAVRRLYQRINRKTLRSQVRWLPKWDEICLWSSTLFPREALEGQLSMLMAEVAFLDGQPTPHSRADFEARQEQAGMRIAAATQTIASAIPQIMEAYHRVRLVLSDLPADRYRATHQDIEMQLENLMHATFLSDTPWRWLSQFPRYLRAIEYRIERNAGATNESSAITELRSFWHRLDSCNQDSDAVDRSALSDFRWMLEEYRVSLFAQHLGTSVKVSPQRLEKQWEKTKV